MEKVVATVDEEFTPYPLHLTGYASTLPADEANDVVARLHAVVREVTGKEVETPPKARMGFL